MKKNVWIAIVAAVVLGMMGFALPAAVAEMDLGGPVVFNDPVLEASVREALGVPEGDISAETARQLDWLDASMPGDTPDSDKIHDISALRWFTGLYGLRMDNNAIEDIWPLADLNNLHELWLLDNPITDLTPLAGLTNLEKLGFTAFMQEVTFLKNMSGLVELAIYGLREVPADLPELTHLAVFCSLGGEISDISVLAQCPQLHVVDLSWNLVSDLAPLKDLPLTELYLDGNPIDDYTPIAELYPNLVGRNFEYVELLPPENPDEGISFPDPALEEKIRAALDIPDGKITVGDAAQVTNLRIANDWQPQIPQESKVSDLTGLEYFINLRDLDAGFNNIADLGPLAGLSQLVKLNFGSNAIADLTPLSGLANLEELTLYGCAIRDISPLAALGKLRSLHLGNNPLGDISPLRDLTSLDSLNIAGCGLEDISALAGLTNMYALEIMDNFISDLSPLAGMQNLHVLRLANNPIADYTLIAERYPQLEDKDFEMGQTYDVDVPLKPENPDAAVEIPDAALEAILREATGVYDRPLTQQDMCNICKLVVSDDAMWRDVSDIWPLRYCLNLEGLIINVSQVEALDGLSMLNKLSVLAVNDSRVTNIEALRPLADQLLVLELRGNQLEDIATIAEMVNLESLDLRWNMIQDFSPIYGLTRLGKLMINFNMTENASGLRDIAGGLMEKDFDPDQPLELGGQGEAESENPDQAIVFPDPLLELAIRKALDRPEGDITTSDAAAVDWLNLGIDWQDAETDQKITDLTGLEYFTHLHGLELGNQSVRDLTPLVGLEELEILNLLNNGIEDIALLAQMQSLGWLELRGNAVTDISPLGGLTTLYGLLLEDNLIEDLSPLDAIYENLTEKDF